MAGTGARPATLDVSLGDLTVGDAMHDGVISCPPSASLREVARMLSDYRVHAIIVLPRHEGEAGHASEWKVVSDLDLVRAASQHDLDATTIGELAGGPVRCVQADEPLASAALTMLANRAAHVIVIDRKTGRPFGVLSALDLARALAGRS